MPSTSLPPYSMTTYRQAHSLATSSAEVTDIPNHSRDENRSVVPDNLSTPGCSGQNDNQTSDVPQSQQLNLDGSSLANTREKNRPWYSNFIRFFSNSKRTRGSSTDTTSGASSEQAFLKRPWNYLRMKQTVMVEELKETDIVVALMGPTGSGKSSFISRVAGTDVGIGHSLVSHTSQVKAVRVHVPDADVEMVLVDTPGFDDTYRSDYEILKLISGWLEQTGHKKIFLDGILYLHRISSNRMSGTPLKNLEIFEKICGPRACSRVVMVTTMWDKLPDEETGEARLAELKATFWKPMIDRGSKTERYRNTSESAWCILGPFLLQSKRQLLTPTETGRQKQKGPVRLQYETVQQQKDLPTTGAGRALYEDIRKIEKRHKSLTLFFRKQMNKPWVRKETNDLLFREYDQSKKSHEAVLAELHKPRRPLLRIFHTISVKQ